MVSILSGLLSCLPVPAWAQSANANSSIRTGPVPEWVDHLDWQLLADSPTGTSAQFILLDQQSKLFPSGGDYYYHQVVKLLTQQGVSAFSQQTNQVSPEFEDVTWHKLVVHREGKSYDRLTGAEFNKLQREPGLEAQMLTGEITYAAVLSDIRGGDILETEYTTHYLNPLFGGQTSASHYLGSANPVLRERVVVHVPATLGRVLAGFELPDGTAALPGQLYRHAQLRSAMNETSTATEKIFTWEGRALPAIEFDPAIPGRAYPYWPMFRVSTFVSWEGVVQWATPLFSETTLPEPAAKLVEVWKKGDEDQRLEDAVHWVQDEVRYFALDLGQHTLKPRPLADVCTTRFGDCKDKTLLLVALLRALGIEAWPALVNTYWRDRLRDVSPAPRAFNHAIVAYRHRGQLKWIDPTMTKQGGTVGNWAVPPLRLGLIIKPNENQLTKIENASGKEPDTEVLDHISVDATTGEATLVTQVQMRGLIADYYRPSLASLNPDERSKGWFNFIAQYYRRLEEAKAPAFEDDPKNNTIVLRAEYKIPNFVGRDNQRTYVSVYGYLLRTLIAPGVSRRRHWPLALPSDRHLRHRIEVDLPFMSEIGQLPEVIHSGGLKYSIERGVFDQQLVVQHDLSITQDEVPADQMNQFCDNLQEILDALSTIVFKAPESKAQAQTSSAPSNASTPEMRKTP